MGEKETVNKKAATIKKNSKKNAEDEMDFEESKLSDDIKLMDSL